MNSARAESFDVIVLGGGPAGCAVAVAAIRVGYRVLILDGARRPAAPFGETLAATGVAALSALGLGPALDGMPRIASLGVVSLWDSLETAEADSILDVYGTAWHVQRDDLNSALRRRVSQLGVVFQSDATVVEQRRTETGEWDVRFQVGRAMRMRRSRWLVDATGRRAWLMRRLGVRRERLDQLVAVMFDISVHSIDQRLAIEAVPNGWWYYSPLPRGRAVATHVTDHENLPAPRHDNCESWQARLRQTRLIGPRVGTAAPLRRPSIVAVNSSYAIAAAGNGWRAVGDAALTHDPISGAGICRGIVSGVQAALSMYGADNGDQHAAARYQRWFDGEFARYSNERTRIYSLAKRWRHEPFWARRGDSAAVGGGSPYATRNSRGLASAKSAELARPGVPS